MSSNDLNTISRIYWFDDFEGENKYSFLSNFYEGEPILIGEDKFATGEHAFQAAKAKTRKAFEMVRDARSPGESKGLGRRIPLRLDWEAVKYDVMALVIRAKFHPMREEGSLLIKTGDRLLVEGTYWGDKVWGTDLKSYETRDNPPGRNWLGTLLMARRAELRAYQQLSAPLRFAEEHLEFGWLWFD